MNTEDVLFSLIRMEVCGGTVSGEVKSTLCTEMLEALYALSVKHDLSHIAGQALTELGILGEDEISRKFKQAAMQAVYRYVRLNSTLNQLCKALENAKLPFMPLKGSVLRDAYPEAWMRTSCDIDVLVKPEDLDGAVKTLVDGLGFRYDGTGPHDASLFSPLGVHIELHYDLIEDTVSKEQAGILSGVWACALGVDGWAYKKQMPDQMFYFYHIAHMAKHFMNGGCGIRPFLDIWILKRTAQKNEEERSSLLRQGGLLNFARAAEELAEIWFSDRKPDDLSCLMQEYVLTGGVYGNMENRVTVNQKKRGGKLRYAMSRIFLPYKIIKFHYPVLQKQKWLLPFYEVARWFKLLFKGGVKRSARELRTNAAVSTQDSMNAAELLDYLGL